MNDESGPKAAPETTARKSFSTVAAQDDIETVPGVGVQGAAEPPGDRFGRHHSVSPESSADHSAALGYARYLVEHGVPVFIAQPVVSGGEWDPRGGPSKTGYWLPKAWQTSVPDPSVIDRWRPGDALCAVTGVVVDLLDVDPRSGGLETQSALREAGIWPVSYGRASTPSGGTHDFVRLLGVRSRDGLRPGLDVKAGTPDGHGRGFAFIAPTMKTSKATGQVATYLWTEPPHFDDIDPDDESGLQIAEMIGNTRAASTGRASARFELPAVIPTGERDGTLFRYASALRASGMSIVRALELMTKAWEVCEQPAGDHYRLDAALAKIDQVWTKYPLPLDDATTRPIAGDARSDQALHHGQLRMAYFLATSHQDRMMFVHGLGWHGWQGTHWAEDDQGVAEQAVHHELSTALRNALDNKDDELKKDVRRCETANAISGILAIAATRPEFAHTVRSLDPDPYLLNVANGTLDLRTLRLHEHDPADRITKRARAAYRPGLGGDRWLAFLADVLPDPTVRDFVQRLGGVALLGTVKEHVLPILTGTGANGKGTFYKALLYAMGDYAATADPELFMHREGAHPTGEMDLRGRRLIVVSESDKDRSLAEATMKRLTGGDPIKARHMRQDFVEFQPSHLPMLITNHLPRVSGDDPAIWRRIRVVPFGVTFADADQDRGLDDALRLDADAVLTWMIDGYRDYTEKGLSEPEAVLVATSDYHLDSDALGRFISDRCLTGPQCQYAVGPLFEAWVSWSTEDGTAPGSKKALGLALGRRGFPEFRSAGRRYRKGIHLRPADDDTDDG